MRAPLCKPLDLTTLCTKYAASNSDLGRLRVSPLQAKDTEDLKPDSGVPESVKEQQVEFWVCARCGKVYWQVSTCLSDALFDGQSLMQHDAAAGQHIWQGNGTHG